MYPYPAPCRAGDKQVGDRCYPPFQSHVLKIGNSYSFILGGIVPDMLPTLSNSAGDGAHITVTNVDGLADVTISTVSPKAAADLFKTLNPIATSVDLPD